MKQLMFARQTDPSDLIPMPGLCRAFGRDWEGNEKDGGVECLDANDPHWRRLLDDGALVPLPLPQGTDSFAPFAEFIGPVRKAFEAFGLAKDDEETWSRVKRNIDLIAREHRRLRSQGAIPKPTEIRAQLKGVEEGALKFAAALDALSEPALDWILAYNAPLPLFPRSRAGGQSPGEAPIEFLRFRDTALAAELAAHLEILSKWRIGPINEDQAHFQESLQDLTKLATTAQDDAEIAKAQRTAQLLKAFGLRTPPAPYHIRDRLAGRTRAIGALAKKALARLAEHGPHNPSNKSDKKVLGRTPRGWLVECCVDLIERTFGPDGLRNIKAYRKDSTHKEGAALFADLLRAVEQYATGEKPSSFSEATNQITQLREERLRQLGEQARVSGRPPKIAKSTATPNR
jgi:hypothetical protein